MSNNILAKHLAKQKLLPRIVYGTKGCSSVTLNPVELTYTMRALGISDSAISLATIYVDPKSRFQTFGTHYPNRLGRLRFYFIPEIRISQGHIVRLSMTIKGRPRTAKEMNRTLVHELEHLAQGDRHDTKVTLGHISIWGLAGAGILAGGLLGKTLIWKLALSFTASIIGHSIGYLIAPHERQARMRSRQLKSVAVSCSPVADVTSD